MKYSSLRTLFLLAVTILLPNIVKGEVISSSIYDNAIVKGLAEKKRSAVVNYHRCFPSTPPDQADSIEVTYSDIYSYRNPKTGNKEMSYLRWRMMLQNLEDHQVRSKYKVYVDGVYKRDSLKVDHKYRIYGPLTLYNFSNREDLFYDNPSKTDYKGITYIEVTYPIYELFKNYGFEANNTSEDKEELFKGLNKLYLSGPDSTFVSSLDKNHKIKYEVKSDEMVISLLEKNNPLKRFVLNKEAKSSFFTSNKLDTNNKNINIYPTGEQTPSIKFKDNKITFTDNNGSVEYNIGNNEALIKAVRLSKIRHILNDSYSEMEVDHFLYGW